MKQVLCLRIYYKRSSAIMAFEFKKRHSTNLPRKAGVNTTPASGTASWLHPSTSRRRNRLPVSFPCTPASDASGQESPLCPGLFWRLQAGALLLCSLYPLLSTFEARGLDLLCALACLLCRIVYLQPFISPDIPPGVSYTSILFH